MIVVCSVIENAFVKIVARGIESVLEMLVAEVGATVLLLDGVEDVEKLINTGEFVVGGTGIELGEGGFDEASTGREVAGESDGAHAAAVSRERELRREGIDWVERGEMLIVIEAEDLLGEGRVIGEDAEGIVIDLETGSGGLDGDRGVEVGNHPVEFGSGELGAEGGGGEVELAELSLDFGDSGALTEEPGDEFELSEVGFIRDR